MTFGPQSESPAHIVPAARAGRPVTRGSSDPINDRWCPLLPLFDHCGTDPADRGVRSVRSRTPAALRSLRPGVHRLAGHGKGTSRR